MSRKQNPKIREARKPYIFIFDHVKADVHKAIDNAIGLKLANRNATYTNMHETIEEIIDMERLQAS